MHVCDARSINSIITGSLHSTAYQRIRDCTNAINRLERDRADARAAAGNRLARFGGAKMVQLADLVAKNLHRFREPPIGPLGAALALTDDRWKVAAEAVLGPHLNAWAVHCRDDERLLRSLASQAGLFSLTVVVKRFDLPAYVVPPDVARAARPPYLLLRDLVVIEHARAHVIDKLLIDLVRLTVPVWRWCVACCLCVVVALQCEW